MLQIGFGAFVGLCSAAQETYNNFHTALSTVSPSFGWRKDGVVVSSSSSQPLGNAAPFHVDDILTLEIGHVQGEIACSLFQCVGLYSVWTLYKNGIHTFNTTIPWLSGEADGSDAGYSVCVSAEDGAIVE